jgi:hypothetical protein
VRESFWYTLFNFKSLNYETTKNEPCKHPSKLSRNEMKTIMAGSGACVNCSQLCNANDYGSYDWGMCSPQTGGTSCHNYCCYGGYCC